MLHPDPIYHDLPRPEDSPIAWFGEILLAVDRGDFQRAADAQRQLVRLGWCVRYRKPRQRREGGGR
jgi:hypothetical protein